MRAFSLLTFGLLLFTSLLAETFDIADFGARGGEPLAEARDCGRIVLDNVRIEGFRKPEIVAHTPVAVEVRGGTPVTVNRGKSNQGKDR